MATRTQVKGVKKQRFNSKAGHRRRAKNKISVVEKRRLRLLKEKIINE